MDQTRAIRFAKTGGPEMLSFQTIDLPAPGAGEVRLRHIACGVNYIDTYHRVGLYPLPLPSGIGLEAAGIVEAVGPGVKGFAIGDRVAYCSGPIGAYAERRNYPAERLIALPAEIDERKAAAIMLKGMTVEYLIRRTYAVKPGDWVLFHAAAGGVGQIAVQWLKALGARVIGTAGGAEKCALVADLGAEATIDYRKEDWVAAVRKITGGRGVDVVYDGVGKDTCVKSMDCLRPRGFLVTFGNASGPVPPIEPLILTQKGSIFLTRPSLMHYTESRADLELSARSLFEAVTQYRLRIEIGGTYPLAEAAEAHRDLEARLTTGSLILEP